MERINVSNERQSMIYPEELKPIHVGQWVEHRPPYGKLEIGRIRAWNNLCISVVFSCGNWDEYRSKKYTAVAVDPHYLDFIHRPRGIACLPSYAGVSAQ